MLFKNENEFYLTTNVFVLGMCIYVYVLSASESLIIEKLEFNIV